MRALLLAAGLGTRLKPLTNHVPKCLVPINGRPLIDYWLECLLENEIDEVIINTHYMATLVEEYLIKSSWLPYLKIRYEENLLGTGGTIVKNREFFSDDAFLVAHADNLTKFDLKDFTERHKRRPSNTELTMMLFKAENPEACGIVSLDSREVVKCFHEKVRNPPGNLANGAVYIIEPSVVDWMVSLGKPTLDLSTEVIPNYLGRIFTFLNSEYHRDIGTVESWIKGNIEFPPCPALEKNRQAWLGIVNKDNGLVRDILKRMSKEVGDDEYITY